MIQKGFLAAILLLVVFSFRHQLKTLQKQQARILKNRTEDRKKEELLFRDINILQQVNGIQTTEYRPVPREKISPEERKKKDFETKVLKGYRFLKNKHKEVLQTEQVNKILESEGFAALLRRYGLQLRKNPSSFLFLQNKIPYFELKFTERGPALRTLQGNKQEVLNLSSEELTREIRSGDLSRWDAFFHQNTLRIEKEKGAYRERIRNVREFFARKAIQEILKRYNLIWKAGAEGARETEFLLYKKTRRKKILLKITVSYDSTGYRLGGEKYADLSAVEKNFEEAVIRSDIFFTGMKETEEKKRHFESFFRNSEFEKLLENDELKIRDRAREDQEYYYFDLLDRENRPLGSFAVQKSVGAVYLMDKDDVPLRSFNSLGLTESLPGREKGLSKEEVAKLSRYRESTSSKGKEYFLLVGTHEFNADTIIVAAADARKKKISLISIPRDLYYQGAKINHIYQTYGGEMLARALSKILGRPIKSYIGIDMYAFIEVINILGGVDIVLDENLVDITYKVKENGEWSTLAYKKGAHHLNGIEALRIVRSRHSSSDFERSKRQQKVLRAVKTRLSEASPAEFYKLLKVLLKFVKTNMSPSEIIRLFNKYRDSRIEGQYQLDTSNVLYSTYSNLYVLPEEEQIKALADPDFYKGGWIVLPKNNDWKLIRWYLNSILNR